MLSVLIPGGKKGGGVVHLWWPSHQSSPLEGVHWRSTSWVCLAMQGKPVQSLVLDDPVCHRVTEPTGSGTREAATVRSPHGESPTRHSSRAAPTRRNQRNLWEAAETQQSHKQISEYLKKKNDCKWVSKGPDSWPSYLKSSPTPSGSP